MIFFRKMVICNFMSYKGKQSIHLANKGIIRIEGVNEDDPSADSNMSGKSSIVEALLWCLFGRTLRGLKHGAIVNRKSKANCFVSTTFVTSGVLYTCRRYRNHKRHRNKLVLFRKSTCLSSRHESDTQTRLENILGCDFESFVNSAVFGGFDTGSRKQFALQTDAQQKQILDSFLKFEKFEIALKRTKHELQESLDKHSELQLTIRSEKGALRFARQRLTFLKANARSAQKEKDREQLEIRRKIKSLSKSKAPSSEKIQRVRDKVETSSEKKADAEARLRELRRQLEFIAKKRLNREKLTGKPCPTCGHMVGEKNLIAFFEHLKRDRTRLLMEKEVIVEALHTIEKEVRHGRVELKRLLELKSAYELSLSRIALLEERLSPQKDASSKALSEEIERAERQYGKKVSGVLAREHEEQLLKDRIKDLKFWEVGFGNKGVKALIVREILPAMNQKLKEYSGEVFEKNVELEFRPSKETKEGSERELFNIHYHTRRNADSYNAESSGGKRRIDICILLVFAWLSHTCDFLFVDELLDSLDASGRERVLSILGRQRGTVLVISHDRELKSRIGNVWTVRKHHGVSRLETSYA